jgi:hypothetical protein
VKTFLVLLVAAAAGAAVWLAGSTIFGKDPVTKADIERKVSKLPRGHVAFTLCNREIVPSANPQPDPPDQWTCDTYIGPSPAEAQNNGPSYRVLVKDGEIRSIRQVPTH